ncbi:hypothetical protein Col01nite_20990 [Cellulomonas oligotrophica]|uniref:Uncharacterized protein n=1 Tax=Cellulomonas oligotrophica TaxID=931536 RepID=A0ABQ4DB40_9CELL|nr:hypothetical protein Col01nite_20990 [Cellulomonas oligotrophica]
MVLRLIGAWRTDERPELPDPVDLVDETWDHHDRRTVTRYLATGTFLREVDGPPPCPFCARPGGDHRTDGVLAWPAVLAHEVGEHGVRLPGAVEAYVLDRVARLGAATVSADWWEAGAPDLEPLAPPERLVWGGNVQLVQQPGRRFPGLLVQGDTLASHVDGPRSARLLRDYEEMMSTAGLDRLPY